MRDFAQPATLKSAAIAALLTAVASYPRLLMWTSRKYSVWYLEAVIFLGTIVLWAFVFAWHSKYAGRPVVVLKPAPRDFVTATLIGVAVAAALGLLVDPAMRVRTPGEYPHDIRQWIAITLFTLAFSQLVLVFAPLAWLLRLTRNRQVAVTLTVMFGAFVLAAKAMSSAGLPSLPLLAGLILVRLIVGTAALFLYWRGGLLLAWWLGLLIQVRHLFFLGIGS